MRPAAGDPLHRSSSWLAAALVALLPLAAHAEPKDDARRAFAAGLAAAERGDYAEALVHFLEAQAAVPHPATMFNIARAYEDLGQPEMALSWYRDFKVVSPERASEVDGPVRRIEALLARRAAEAAEAAAVGSELEALRRRVAELEGGSKGPPDAAPRSDDATPPPEESPGGAFLTEAYERVVFSASRTITDPLDSPSAITVITEDDIRQSGATSFGDVLRRVVGVDVMSMSTSVPYVGIRGFNQELTNKVLWLIDGRSVYMDFIGTPLPVSLHVGLDEVERIEVIRGPGSALYGANAVTGVVNILTKRPGEGRRLDASLSVGAPNLFLGSVTASGKSGKLGYRVGAGYQQEGRWAQEPNTGDPTDALVVGPDDPNLAERRFRADARFDVPFAKKGWASLSGGFANGFGEYYSIGELGNFSLEGQTLNLRGDLAYGPVHLRTFWNRTDGRTAPWAAPRGIPRDLEARVRDDAVDVELEGTFPLKSGPVDHLLHAGIGYRYKEFRFDYMQGDFETPHIEHHASAFIQEQLTWKWLGVVASLRLDRHPLIDISQTISPRGALIFRVAERTALRASAGTAYRAMNGLESYMDLELNTVADGYFVRYYGGQTNPDGKGLVPERILTVEVGARDESTAFHTLDAAVYWNRVTDLIGLAPVNARLSPFDPERGGFMFGESGWANFRDTVYDSVGGEVAVEVFPAKGLDLLANLTLQKTFERTGDVVVEEQSSPFVKFNVGATYRAPFRMDFSAIGHFYGPETWRLREFDDTGGIDVVPRSIPSRFLLSVRIAGRPIPKSDLELGFTLWNPVGFVTRFQEHPEGQPLGPRMFGTVSYRL